MLHRNGLVQAVLPASDWNMCKRTIVVPQELGRTLFAPRRIPGRRYRVTNSRPWRRTRPPGSETSECTRGTAKRRNGVRRLSDALPASSQPLGESGWHLRRPPRNYWACVKCMALGQEHLVRQTGRRSGVAVLSRTGAVECRRAKWRTGNGHRNVPRIATLRPGSLAKDLRPSGHSCQELARSATGVLRAARRAARRQSPRRPGHGRSTRVHRLRTCSFYW